MNNCDKCFGKCKKKKKIKPENRNLPSDKKATTTVRTNT